MPCVVPREWVQGPFGEEDYEGEGEGMLGWEERRRAEEEEGEYSDYDPGAEEGRGQRDGSGRVRDEEGRKLPRAERAVMDVPGGRDVG